MNVHPQPQTCSLRRSDGGELLWRNPSTGAFQRVELKQAFPFREPAAFLSLLDDSGHEVAFIGDTDELEDTSRTALQPFLKEAGFAIEIAELREIQVADEDRFLAVRTALGCRTFQLADGSLRRDVQRIFLKSVCGDLYRVTHPERLDGRSRRLLEELMGEV